jgi:hypothetical protein
MAGPMTNCVFKHVGNQKLCHCQQLKKRTGGDSTLRSNSLQASGSEEVN